jgi:iron(III) transport system permease protein
MRTATRSERFWDCAAALLLLGPLLFAFWRSGFGGPWNSAGNDGALSASARWAVLSAATCRSLAIGLGAASLALLIGIPAGWALSRRGRSVWLMVFCALPLALPASVGVSGWVALLAPEGAASRFNTPIPGFLPASRGWLFSSCGAALALGSLLWPVVAFEVWPALRRARNESLDAALLAAAPARVFWRIVLPQCKGEIAAAGLLVFLIAGSDFSVCSLLLVRTLPTEINDALSQGHTRQAAWAALPLAAVALLGAILLMRLHSAPVDSGNDRRDRAGGPARGSVVLLILGVALGFLAPMSGCLIGALRGGKSLATVFGSGSDALLLSVRLASGAAILAFLAALARVLWRPQTRLRALNTAAVLLLAVPGAFLAAALLNLQQTALPVARGINTSLADTLPAAVLACGYCWRFIYLPLRLVEEGLAGLDRELLDAAALTGHSRVSAASVIALPLVLPHMLAGAALVFILALGEVPLTAPLAPPGAMPATVWLFQQQHMGYTEAVFGLSLLLGGAAAGVLLICGAVASRLFSRLGG